MRAVFTHITGIRRGQREAFTDPQITVGRAPDSILAFAPTDTRASAHHAEISFDGTGYVIRDAGSTNGTYVNGRRVYSARLKPGDVIEFGMGGPQVQFELEGSQDSLAPMANNVAPTQALDTQTKGNGASSPATPSKEFGRTTVRLMIDHAVKKSSTQFKVLVSTLSLLVVLLVSVVAYLAWMTPTPTPAGPNFPAIAKQNQGAVVFIYVRFALSDEKGAYIEEDASTGSGFVVSPEGYIVTNRHVLQLWEYEPVWTKNRYTGTIREIKVVFADHSPDEAMPAEVVKISDSTDTDIAILRVQPFQNMPVLSQFNRETASIGQGDPVAVIGYPFGKELFDFTKSKVAETSYSQGVVSKVSLAKIQIDASANPGNSGGPIFDQNGRVIAVLTQGLASMGAQNINFGTPIGQAIDLLPTSAPNANR